MRLSLPRVRRRSHDLAETPDRRSPKFRRPFGLAGVRGRETLAQRRVRGRETLAHRSAGSGDPRIAQRPAHSMLSRYTIAPVGSSLGQEPKKVKIEDGRSDLLARSQKRRRKRRDRCIAYQRRFASSGLCLRLRFPSGIPLLLSFDVSPQMVSVFAATGLGENHGDTVAVSIRDAASPTARNGR